ncbi:MAG TPA: hypothetical protein VD701_05055, partial [Steroidobacteraceae bacterium]|nr:hypothetical protein [Steroidobacteraceae bacterium]
AKDAEHHELKKFLRNKLYRHERMQATRLGAGQALKELFEAYFHDVALMPEEHEAAARAAESAAGKAGRARAVADYVAGMTDRYAFEAHRRLAAGGASRAPGE